jgi:hypothetical protein
MISKDFFKETETNVYPSKNKRWDRYKAFHMTNVNFVEFETGELMVVGTPDPDARKYYPEYDIQLVTTADAECPKLFLDKELTQPVKKAWVTHKGQQQLAVDYDRGVAVALYDGWVGTKHTVLGEHVERARVYWAGQSRLPVPLAKIKVQTPDPEYKKKMASVLSEVRAAVSAIYRINHVEDEYSWGEPHLADRKWYDSSASDVIAEMTKDEQVMFNIADKGFEYPRKLNEVEFLYVGERK